MDINMCYEKNGIRNLATIYGEAYKEVSKEELKQKLLLEDPVFRIGFVTDVDDLEDEADFYLYGAMSLGRILDELAVQFRDFCKETGADSDKVVYICYVGHQIRTDNRQDRDLTSAMESLGLAKEDLVCFLNRIREFRGKTRYAGSRFLLSPASELAECAYRMKEHEYRCLDAANAAEERGVSVSPEDVDMLADAFLSRLDCETAENDLWNWIFDEYGF